MALNYDYITGMMNKKYLKKAEDNIFREDHYIQSMLMKKTMNQEMFMELSSTKMGKLFAKSR